MRYKPLDPTAIIRDVKDYVWEKHNFRRQNLTAAMVAEELGISRSSLMSIFKAETGITFLEYLNDCRVRHSRKMVMKNHGHFPMEHIQTLSGFGSLQSFYSKYKERYGELPSETDKR